MLIGNQTYYRFSKKTFLTEQRTPYILPDGTPGYKNYSASENNRFIFSHTEPAETATKNRLLPPTKVFENYMLELDLERTN